MHLLVYQSRHGVTDGCAGVCSGVPVDVQTGSGRQLFFPEGYVPGAVEVTKDVQSEKVSSPVFTVETVKVFPDPVFECLSVPETVGEWHVVPVTIVPVFAVFGTCLPFLQRQGVDGPSFVSSLGNLLA